MTFSLPDTSRGAHEAITRPFSITVTLSATGSSSSKRCSAIMTVKDNSRFILQIVAINSEAAIGSSLLVGSSSIKIFGCITITEARFKSCFCPPDNSLVFLPNQPSIPKYEDISATLRRITSLSSPKLSSPNANSCHTLSVTIWLSGFCITKPISAAEARPSSSQSFLPR